MTSSLISPDHPLSTHESQTDRDPVLRDSVRGPGVGQEDVAALFRAEVAALLALDDAAFGDVLPAIRPAIVAVVPARGPIRP